jgi:hypothetical protein
MKSEDKLINRLEELQDELNSEEEKEEEEVEQSD